MSGIAQIIQAMMSASPQITPMVTLGGGGGGGVSAPSAMGGDLQLDFGSDQPRQPQPQMPEIAQLANDPMQQQQPPGYPGSQMQGPPDPSQQYNPQDQGQPGTQALERQYLEAQQLVEKYANPQTPKDAWTARKNLPMARERLRQAESNIMAFNQSQQQIAQDQRYQRARQVLMDNNTHPDKADVLARQAAVDPRVFEQITSMAMDERKSVNQLGRDQREEFRDDMDQVGTLMGFGIPQEYAEWFARDDSLSTDQAVKLWHEDQDRVVEQQQLYAQEQAGLRDKLFEADQAILTTEKALEDLGITSAGFGAYLKDINNLPAKDLHEALETLRAMQGFKALYDMRQASPTGGALGNVSNMEVKLLYSAWTNLNQGQSNERLRKNLNEVRDRYKRVKFLIELEQEGELKGLNALEQKRMADQFINKTHIEAFREMRPATADKAMELLKAGKISKSDFEDRYGFLPLEGTY